MHSLAKIKTQGENSDFQFSVFRTVLIGFQLADSSYKCMSQNDNG
jgi:hypothetical protein